MTSPEINSHQHCTSISCDYTFSHTAMYCGFPQVRRCSCPYCYPTLTGNEETVQKILAMVHEYGVASADVRVWQQVSDGLPHVDELVQRVEMAVKIKDAIQENLTMFLRSLNYN